MRPCRGYQPCNRSRDHQRHVFNAQKERRFIFLQKDAVIIDGITFIGAALWTDYEIHGTRKPSMAHANLIMNDHIYISISTATETREEIFMPTTAAQSIKSTGSSSRASSKSRNPARPLLPIICHWRVPSLAVTVARQPRLREKSRKKDSRPCARYLDPWPHPQFFQLPDRKKGGSFTIRAGMALTSFFRKFKSRVIRIGS